MHITTVRETKRKSLTISKCLPSLSDCNWTRTHTHLVRKQTLNHLAKLTK